MKKIIEFICYNIVAILHNILMFLICDPYRLIKLKRRNSYKKMIKNNKL